MKLHVFVGADLANIHLALKIRNIEPDVDIIFMDKQLQVQTRNFDRNNMPAHIICFDNATITQCLLMDGVDETELSRISYDRDFLYEHGLVNNHSNQPKRFKQVQCRDLQQLLFDTLDAKLPRPLLIAKTPTPSDGLKDSVIEILFEHNMLRQTEVQDIKIHVTASANISSTLVPQGISHEMIAFHIKDLEHHKTLVECSLLEQAQQPLESTTWSQALKYFDWDLIRPPRLYVYYAHDILLIDVETPQTLLAENEEVYRTLLLDYASQIITLIFPSLADILEKLDVHIEQESPLEERDNAVVTNFLMNNMYADIYVYQSFHDLYEWAKSKGYLGSKEACISESDLMNKIKANERGLL